MNSCLKKYHDMHRDARKYRDEEILKKFEISMEDFKKNYINYSAKEIYANKDDDSIKCECGSKIRKSYLETHLKSKIHARRIAKLNEVDK